MTDWPKITDQPLTIVSFLWTASDGNLDGMVNSRFTIAVGAVNPYGLRASYTSPGSPVLISAPGGDRECTCHLSIVYSLRLKDKIIVSTFAYLLYSLGHSFASNNIIVTTMQGSPTIL